MRKLEGKVAIVTGGGTGIGKAAALRFAQEGAKIAVTGRRQQPLNDVVREIERRGGLAIPIPSDVGQVADTRRIVDQTVQQFGALHVLFNNAATVDLHKTAIEMSVEEWDDACLNVTLRSVFLTSKWAAPEMRKAGGGSIINCGSVAGIMAWAGGAAYCAAKGGVLQLTKALAIEYGPWRIRVNTLSPGAVMTPNLQAAIEQSGHLERLKQKSVFQRVGGTGGDRRRGSVSRERRGIVRNSCQPCSRWWVSYPLKKSANQLLPFATLLLLDSEMSFIVQKLS